MKKLNNKGYLTIEIILSAVIAFTIAFFLIEITINFSNASDNYYLDTIFITDKALVSNYIKKDIQKGINEKGIITNVSCNNNTCTITYNDNTTKELKYNSDNKKIEYDSFSKEMKRVNFKSLSVCDSDGCSSNVTKNYAEGDYIRFVISFNNTFNKNNYDINILIYNGNTEINELLVDHIVDLYENAEKTVVSNNCTVREVKPASNNNNSAKAMPIDAKKCSVDYNYATSVNLMNDRLGGTTKSLNGGNIRYFGNRIYDGVTEEDNDGYIEIERWRQFQDNPSYETTQEQCREEFDLDCNNYQTHGFSSKEECDVALDNVLEEKGVSSVDELLKQFTGGKYHSVDELCSIEKRYYKDLNNYIDIGDKYEKDFIIKNWESYFIDNEEEEPIPNNTEECNAWATENEITDRIISKNSNYDTVSELCSVTTIPAGTSILYRIIGVFDGRVRVMRDTGIGFYSYDTDSSEETRGLGTNEWNDSDLKKLLNSGYEDNTDSKCVYDKDNDTFNCETGLVNNSLWYNNQKGICYNGKYNTTTSCDFTSNGLSDFVKDKIVDQTVYLGTGFTKRTLFPENIYIIERSTLESDNKKGNKIALPNASDFGYAVDFRYCSNSSVTKWETCRPTSYGCEEYNWMSEGTSWTITSNEKSAFAIQGRVFDWGKSYPVNSRPVLTLDPSLSLSGGTGSKDDPYLLEGVTFVPGEINLFEQNLNDSGYC